MNTTFDHVYERIRLFASDGRWILLMTLAAGWFFGAGVRVMYPVMIPQIRSTFGLNNTIAGFLYTVIVVMIAIVQFPSGIVSDRVGERAILLMSVVSATVGVVMLAGAPIFLVFLGGCVLFGLGSGLFQPPTISAISKVFTDRAGTAHGVIFASGSIGTTILPIVAGFTAVSLGWRFSFAFVVPVFVLIAAGIWAYVPDVKSETSDAPSFTSKARMGMNGVLRLDILLVAAAMVLVVIAFHAVTAFLPTYLIETKALSQRVATTVFGLFFAGSFVFQIVAGIFADRWSKRYILLAITALGSVSIIGLTRVDSLVMVVLFSVVLSSIAAYISVANTYFVSTLPDDIQGSGVGLLRSVIIGIGGTSPLFVGYLADLGQFNRAFHLLAGCLVAAAGVLSYSLVRDRPQRPPA